MADFKIAKDDTIPALGMTLKDANGAAVDLTTAASLRFLMRRRGTLKVDAAPTILDAAAGSIEYQWSAGDTDTAGEFSFEVEVTWNGGGIQTFPTVGPKTLIVREDLG